MRATVLFLLAAYVLAGAAIPTIADKTSGMQRMPGYLPFYWDEKAGKVYLEVGTFGTEFLYYSSLPAGLGSNDIGLDRGQLGEHHVVRWERSGPRILLVQPNYRFRALSQNPDERRAVRDSFAESVLWGFEVQAEEGGRVLVDATEFLLHDAHGVARRLEQSEQGSYTLDPTRSAFYLARTKNFPKNTEVEVTLTFTGEPKGRFVREVMPFPGAITVREHHSFVELPGPGYQPRAFDPRGGFFGIEFADYATPIGEPLIKRYISRHRLQKGGTLTYYLDRGAPEPIRSALLDGARWWAQAFEAAGFPNGFRVELLPEDADPMDIRYNVIQWVHRSTRGWSYGGGIADPRTGEMIKGQVTLGSLRVRQDYLIAEGLLAPYEEGKPRNPAMEQMALARLRQLAAHEVGHTLGLQHNFIASTHNRASVMDYPYPLITVTLSGVPDLSNAYATGIGEWDKVAIRWGYGNDDSAIATAIKNGLVFLTDQDADPPAAHPMVHRWDNGTNPAAELTRLLDIRRRALDRFGEANIQPGAPLATLEEVLVPLYLMHRYQTDAASRAIGGSFYTYALRGDGQQPVKPVPAQEQTQSLAAVLQTISPGALVLPQRVLDLIPPRPSGYDPTRELFPRHTGVTFDPLGAAEAAANLTLGFLFQQNRAVRLVEQHSADPQLPGLGEVMDRVLAATWRAPTLTGMPGAVQRTVESVVLYHLLQLAANPDLAEPVRAIAYEKLTVVAMLPSSIEELPERVALRRYAAGLIHRFQENPKDVVTPKPAEPPGQPLGCGWN